MFLKLENIGKSFGEQRLFEKLSLELTSGKIYSLIGANGSGKTTLFNILTGFLPPDNGRITFLDEDITHKSPTIINKMGMARTFQDLRLIGGLNVRDNVLLVVEKGMFHNATKEEYKKVDEILERVSLSGHAQHYGRDISYGQQKLLTLGCCLANNPKLLLLDEPIAGIDDVNLGKIKNIVLELKKEGRTILQIEHNMEYLEETSDELFALENGELVRVVHSA
ncbi:MAG: ATP-binding cassette domain-containing protein [Bacteroidetes bacterium]|nr:ATP-binding cassette domain-containing protein [Bacteroidota bacterium]